MGGVLATIKATREQTGGQYTLVEILAPGGYPGFCMSITKRMKTSTS